MENLFKHVVAFFSRPGPGQPFTHFAAGFLVEYRGKRYLVTCGQNLAALATSTLWLSPEPFEIEGPQFSAFCDPGTDLAFVSGR